MGNIVARGDKCIHPPPPPNEILCTCTYMYMLKYSYRCTTGIIEGRRASEANKALGSVLYLVLATTPHLISVVPLVYE